MFLLVIVIVGKKDPLANLHSNLSPKYIGFVTPTSNSDNSGSEEHTRKTRRRHNISSNITAAADTSLIKDPSEFADDDMAGQMFVVNDSTSVGYVRRIPKEINDSPDRKNGRKKDFVSPIDKLLKKNGSTADSDQLPEVCSEKNMVYNEDDTSNNNDGKWSDCKSHAEPDSVNNDNAIKEGAVSRVEEGRIESVVNHTKLNESVNETEIREMHDKEVDVNVKCYLENPKKYPDNANLVDTADQIEESPENGTNVENGYSPNMDVNIEPTGKAIHNDAIRMLETQYVDLEQVGEHESNINNEILHNDGNTGEGGQNFKLPIEVSPYNENNENIEKTVKATDQYNSFVDITDKSEHKIDDKIDLDGAETESNTEFVADAPSAKSPSAVSMDSAKGSSIINEGSWMTFSTGDLFWGQIYNYCYWPCMVCPDPDGKSISTKENNISGDQHVMVHVRFFADNARRNWVKRENLMPFTTLEQYQERLDECRDKYGSKSAKFKTFVPKKKQVTTWYEAINEANMVAEVPYEERLEKFYEIFDKSK